MARMFHSSLKLAGILALGLAFSTLSGCVSMEKYNAMKLSRDESTAQLGSAQAQASTATAQYDVLKGQLDKTRSSGDSKEALIANQAAAAAEQQRQIDELNARYRDAISLAGKAGSAALPAPLTSELTALAEQNPGLVDFDSTHGLIKFKSDVTFGAGSAEVNDPAKPVIDQVAKILNGPNASQYDLVVVGHTDNQPVSNPNTKRMGHLDNWYLSVHRAIGVSRELQHQGVSSSRIEVAGYADQRPLVANDNEADKAKNRRVEVMILPTTSPRATLASETVPPSEPASATAEKKAAKPVSAQNKDGNKDVAPPPDRRLDQNK